VRTGRLAGEADRKVKSIIDESLHNGRLVRWSRFSRNDRCLNQGEADDPLRPRFLKRFYGVRSRGLNSLSTYGMNPVPFNPHSFWLRS